MGWNVGFFSPEIWIDVMDIAANNTPYTVTAYNRGAILKAAYWLAIVFVCIHQLFFAHPLRQLPCTPGSFCSFECFHCIRATSTVMGFRTASRPLCLTLACMSKYIHILLECVFQFDSSSRGCAGQQVWGTDGDLEPTVLMQKLRSQPWSCDSGGKCCCSTGAPAGGLM